MSLEKAILFDEYKVEWHKLELGFYRTQIATLSGFWWEQQVADAAGVKVLLKRYERGNPHTSIHTRGYMDVDSLDGIMYLIRGGGVTSDDIAHLNGTPILTTEDNETVYRWPEIVQQNFTQREIGMVAASDLFPQDGSINWELLAKYVVDGKVFIKSMRKIDGPGNLMVQYDDSANLEKYFRRGVRLAEIDYFIVSQPVSFVTMETEGKGFLKGEDVPVEYRCFVADGKVLDIAQHDFDDVHEIPGVVTDASHAFAEAHKQALPWGYVIDWGLLGKDAVVVELNSLIGSGRYPGNDFVKLLAAFAPDHDKERLQKQLPALKEEFDKRMRFVRANQRVFMH